MAQLVVSANSEQILRLKVSRPSIANQRNRLRCGSFWIVSVSCGHRPLPNQTKKREEEVRLTAVIGSTGRAICQLHRWVAGSLLTNLPCEKLDVVRLAPVFFKI